MMAAEKGLYNNHPHKEHSETLPFPMFPRRILLPSPLFQPVLRRIIRHITTKRPELFDRIGPHQNKVFLIDPVNMPLAMILVPDPARPRLKAVKRHKVKHYDAKIEGSFLTLLDMVDGRLDGDALFFTRELLVEGDTEAVVCLRNALDDLEGSIADDIAELFGVAGRAALSTLRRLRKHHHD